MQTQAVVIPNAGQVKLQDVTLKAPGPDDVTIHTAYTSISAGTERMLLAGQMPHPMLQLPVIPGYETVGQVVETGENVSDSWRGRWVYVGGALCYDGINPAWGGQSATVRADVKRVVPLDGVEPRQGVLLALTATALHGVDLTAPAAGDRVLVLGQGPVGQLAARLTCNQDAHVIVTDRIVSRLERSVGDQVINVDETPLSEAVTEPVSTIIEASGSMRALEDSLSLLDKGGTVLLLGYYDRLNLPYMPLFLKEARLLTAREWGPDDLARSRDMIADGTLDVQPLLTHTEPVSHIEAAYDTALNNPDCLKLVIEWQTVQ